ncbi:MAG: hypothetical protein IKU36_12550 [Bacteroidales bacterium]|nr:hypothetical protein [Bacteroidales bacterium]
MNRFNTKFIRLAAVVLFGVSLLSCSSDYEYSYLYRELPFEMERVHGPQIPPRSVSIADFGGVGDGVSLNTSCFAEAVDVLAQNGGGRIVVPGGIWLTGPITLKDSVELHVTKDAVLLLCDDMSGKAMINITGASNVAVTGEGIIDGNAHAWGSQAVPLVSIEDSESVMLSDCVFRNASAVTVSSVRSEGLIFSDIAVRSSDEMGDDALVFDSCRNVFLLDSSIDVDADAVCLRSVENLIVDNCNLMHSNAGFVADGDMTGIIQNVSISGSRVLSSDYGLKFICMRGTGAVVDGLYVNDIVMMNIAREPLFFDLYDKPKAALDLDYIPAGGTTPTFRNIHISNLVCSDATRAMYFGGVPEKNIENIEIKDCSIVSVQGADLRYSSGIVLENIAISQKDSLAYTLANCRNVTMHGCTDSHSGLAPVVYQHNSENVVID